jgi:hypothetical protein
MWPQAASVLEHYVDMIAEGGVTLSVRAHKRNRVQRAALGLLCHPTSGTTLAGLSATPRRVLGSDPRGHLSTAQHAELTVLAMPPACEDRPVRADALRQHVSTGNIRRAVREAERHARCYPTDPRPWLVLAELRCVYERRYARARGVLRAALEARDICELQLAAIEEAGGHDLGNGPSQRLATLRIQVCCPTARM